MINFYLPNIIEFSKLNLTLWNLMKEKPEWFEDNITIGAVYGTFCDAIWNGGRVLNNIYSEEDILFCLQEYESRQIPVRFTWTNTKIEEEHLKDDFCNWIMKTADNGFNEVVINSSLLEEYIRKEYPDYKIISSTTKCLLNKDEIKEEVSKYYLTVLDYRKNKDFAFLKDLTKNKVEILLNPSCPLSCKRRKQHYNFLSELQLNMTDKDFSCNIIWNNFYDNLEKNSAVISKEEFYKHYISLGFTHFKIEGRSNHPVDVIESYIYYMVKEEYKDKVRNLLLKAIW